MTVSRRPLSIVAVVVLLFTVSSLMVNYAQSPSRPATTDDAQSAGKDILARVKSVPVKVAGEQPRKVDLVEPLLAQGGSPTGVIFFLEGFKLPVTHAETAYGLVPFADANGYVLAFGVSGGDGSRSWNAGNCCGRASEEQYDDAGYSRAVIDMLTASYGVAANQKVVIAGFSNGAMLAYRLICSGFDVAGYILVAGSRQIDTCGSPAPSRIAVWQGLQDQVIPYNSGPIVPRLGVETRSTAESLAPIIQGRACSPLAPPSPDAAERQEPVCQGNQVILTTLPSGGHDWPAEVDGLGPLSAMRQLLSG